MHSKSTKEGETKTVEAALIRAGRVLGNFTSSVAVTYGHLEVSASYETGPYFTVWSHSLHLVLIFWAWNSPSPYLK